MGDALTREGKCEEALNAYHKAIELDPEDLFCLFSHCRCSA